MSTELLKEELKNYLSQMTGNKGNTLNFGSDYARHVLLEGIMDIINKNNTIVRDIE
jgi:hypothetical protein